MGRLENDRKEIGTDASMETGRRICEGFAFSIFAKADQEDQSGNADSNTAKTFYAASSFFDILEQFGELDSEVSHIAFFI